MVQAYKECVWVHLLFEDNIVFCLHLQNVKFKNIEMFPLGWKHISVSSKEVMYLEILFTSDDKIEQQMDQWKVALSDGVVQVCSGEEGDDLKCKALDLLVHLLF